jgi:uncharacterized membrane protein YiaA
MYAVGAFVAGIIIALYVSSVQKSDDDKVEDNIKHSRQDLRLIAVLLFAILVLLGVIADRIH